MLLLLGSLLSAFFGPVMGRLLDSQGFKKLFLIGSFLAMTGFGMMYNNSMTIGLQ